MRKLLFTLALLAGLGFSHSAHSAPEKYNFVTMSREDSASYIQVIERLFGSPPTTKTKLGNEVNPLNTEEAYCEGNFTGYKCMLWFSISKHRMNDAYAVIQSSYGGAQIQSILDKYVFPESGKGWIPYYGYSFLQLECTEGKCSFYTSNILRQ